MVIPPRPRSFTPRSSANGRGAFDADVARAVARADDDGERPGREAAAVVVLAVPRRGAHALAHAAGVERAHEARAAVGPPHLDLGLRPGALNRISRGPAVAARQQLGPLAGLGADVDRRARFGRRRVEP